MNESNFKVSVAMDVIRMGKGSVNADLYAAAEAVVEEFLKAAEETTPAE
jgi:hypothetical protein